MEITTNTVNVLKNFAGINSNVVINPGNKIMTISEAKNILACAEVPETFERQVGIYNLTEFLNVISLVENHSIKFNDTHMLVGGNGGRTLIKYYYSDVDMLTTPNKPISMPEADITFTLDQTTLSNLKRAAAVFGHSQLTIEPENGCLKLSVIDIENPTSNGYSIIVDGDFSIDDFKFILNISNLKMVSDDYTVEISKKLISQFTNTDSTLVYWVALEKNSTYGE